MAASDRIVPLVVACPLFLQNLDTSVMATALPSIAHSLNVPVLNLNLTITSYLLSLDVVIGAELVSAAAWWHGHSPAQLLARDFSPAFVALGAMTLLSLFLFVRLRHDEGAELR